MFENDWQEILKEEIKKEYFLNLMSFINKEYKDKIIFPNYENIFRAFKLTPYNSVKVVILGQDPYHGENEADGLAFSVPTGVKTPPSLRNILKEISDKRSNTNLEDWAKQGVFLLNTVLTVEKDKPLSHNNMGWEIFTDSVISSLNKKEKVIFVLLGKNAQAKRNLIDNKHIILMTSHPSPLSAYRGFNGSDIFSKINENLKEPINWIGE